MRTEVIEETAEQAKVESFDIRKPTLGSLIAREVKQKIADEIVEFPIDAAGNKVYVRVIEESKTGHIVSIKGGAEARRCCRAVVIAVGPAAAIEGPRGVFTYPEPGDEIMFGTFSGREVTVTVKGERRDYAIMSQLDILGFVDLAKEKMMRDVDEEIEAALRGEKKARNG